MSLQFEVDHEFVGNMPQLMTEQPWLYNDTLLTGQTVSRWRDVMHHLGSKHYIYSIYRTRRSKHVAASGL